jgi:outer membrane protein
MKVKKFLSICSVLLTSVVSFAQDPVGREITMTEAIKLGLHNSPDLLKSGSEKEEARAQFSQYKGALFPTINLRGEALSTKNSAAWLTANDTNSDKRYIAAADFSQPLFTSGALLGGLRLGRVNQDRAEQSYYITQQSLVSRIVQAFYNLAQAQDTLVASQEHVSILESYQKITRRYESIGRTRNIDRMQAETNFTLGRFDILDAQTIRTAAEASLKNLLSLEKEKNVVPKFNITVQPLAKISIDEALATAEKNNPVLRNLRFELDAVKARNQLDLSVELPRLSIEGSAGYQSPDRKEVFSDSSDFYSIGLVLRVPFFSGLSSFGKRRVHKEDYYQAERDLQIKLKAIRQELEVNISHASRLYAQLLEVQNIVKQTRKALDLANQGYNRGIVSPTDILTFQRSRYDAEKRYISIQYDYLRAVLYVRELLGTDLERVYAQ